MRRLITSEPGRRSAICMDFEVLVGAAGGNSVPVRDIPCGSAAAECQAVAESLHEISDRRAHTGRCVAQIHLRFDFARLGRLGFPVWHVRSEGPTWTVTTEC